MYVFAVQFHSDSDLEKNKEVPCSYFPPASMKTTMTELVMLTEMEIENVSAFTMNCFLCQR